MGAEAGRQEAGAFSEGGARPGVRGQDSQGHTSWATNSLKGHTAQPASDS